jgi:MFS family permease
MSPDKLPIEPAARPPLWAVLRHRNYRLFFTGQFLSLFGDWMQIIAQAWLVYRLTGSTIDLGLIAFLNQGPVFFLAALGGILADRLDKRRLIMAAQTAFMTLAAILTVLTFTGLVQVWHVAAIALCRGLINAVEIPARQSLTVELVGREDLQSAVALNSMLFNMARIVGPSVAGVIIAWAGEAWCFAMNTVTFSGVLTALLLMRLPAFVPPPPRRAWTELVEGFRYVRADPVIFRVLFALALSSFAGGPYLTLMPVVAEQVLGTDARGYGLLMTAVGCGALMGAFAMSRLSPAMLARAPMAAAITFGLSIVAFSMQREFWSAFLCILPAAFSLMLQGSASNVIVQNRVEDRLRGRVMAYFTMSFLGMLPFGSLAAGAAAHWLGVPLTLGIGGAICATGGLIAWIGRKPQT